MKLKGEEAPPPKDPPKGDAAAEDWPPNILPNPALDWGVPKGEDWPVFGVPKPKEGEGDAPKVPAED